MKNNKGFTLIEFIISIVIISIIVLIAAPKVSSYTKKAEFTQVIHDVKITEDKNLETMVKENNILPTEAGSILVSDLQTAIDEKKLYNLKGLVSSIDTNKTYKKIDEDFIKSEIKSNLKGDFIITEDGSEVYYKATKTLTDSEEIEDLEPVLKTLDWVRNLGGTGNDMFSSVSQTSDGGYIVVGISISNDFDLLNKHHGEMDKTDAIIAKFTSDGTLSWIKNIGGTEDDTFYSVQQTSDGGYVAVGASMSNDIDLLNKHYGPTIYSDGIIAKFTSDGTLSWIKNIGGNNNDIFYSVQQTSDGGYISVGTSMSNDINLLNKHYSGTGYGDGIIVKFTSDGTLSWIKNIGGSEQDDFKSVQQTSDGGYIAVGTSQSDDYDLLNKHYDEYYLNDAIIVKFTSSGTLSWIKNIGGSEQDDFNFVQQTSDGGYIAVGTSFSNDIDLLNKRYGEEYFDAIIAKFTSDGTLSWIKNIGGSQYDAFNSVQQTSDGGYITVGYSKSNDYDLLNKHYGEAGYFDDGIIAKFTADGTISWIENVGGSEYDLLLSVQQTSHGDYIAVGFSYSIDEDINKSYEEYYADAIIVKFK